MVFNATFKNISVISVEDSRVPRENNRPVARAVLTHGHAGQSPGAART
jgi:hypothetical protein